LRSVEPLFEEFQSCLNLVHASSLLAGLLPFV
jgi:hypothetical protein